MTAYQFSSYVRSLTHTNTTTFPDSQMLIYLTTEVDYLSQRIIEVDEDFFMVPQFTDLVNAQREYALPADILSRFKALEASFDGLSWIRLLPLDLSLYNRTTDENTIQQHFTNIQDNTFYDLDRSSLFIYSGALSGFSNGNQGLKIWCSAWPTPPAGPTLTDNTIDMSIPQTTTEVKIPRNFHKVLATLVCIDYKNSFDKPLSMTQQEQAVEIDIIKALSSVSPVAMEDSPYGELPDRHHQYWDGFDL